MRQKVIKFDPPQFSADVEVGGPLAKTIWHGLMCTLAQALQKLRTLLHTSAVTKPGQSCGVSTKNTATAEVSMVLCVCARVLMCDRLSDSKHGTACMFIHAGEVPLILLFYQRYVCRS